MAKAKHAETPADGGQVELSNAHTEAQPNTLEAVRTLADERAKKIELLEKERDQLRIDLQNATGPAKAGLLSGGGYDVQVAEIIVQTAPDHALVMRVLGEESTLRRLEIDLKKALLPAEKPSPDATSTPHEALTEGVQKTLQDPGQPRDSGEDRPREQPHP